jgi:hypothetical protein
MTSNGVRPEEEVVDNFLLNVVELKFGPIGVRMQPRDPFY